MSTKDEKAAELVKKITKQDAKEKKKAKKPATKKVSSKKPHVLYGEAVNIDKRFGKDVGKARTVKRDYYKNRKKGLSAVRTSTDIRNDAEMLSKYRELEAKESSSDGQTDGMENLLELKKLQEEIAFLKQKKTSGVGK